MSLLDFQMQSERIFFFFLNWGCGGHPAGASSIENYIICGNQM